MQQSRFRVFPIAAGLTAAALLAACGGGDGSGITTPPPPPPPDPPPFGANFSEIQDNVFTPTCAVSGCHTGAGAPQGLRLDAANSFALLVGVASTEVPDVLRVAAGDPDNSYLIQKLEGTAAAGEQMPLGGPPLEQATIDVIRQWISDGAIDDRAPAGDPIRVSTLSIMPGATLDAAPDDIIVEFDRDPDASTVNANTFMLTASGGDGSFGDGNETAVTAASITVPAANTRSAVFDIDNNGLADDTYRITLSGSGASLLLDLGGNVLDGEFDGASFPSGDGTEGGDFEADFEVRTPVAGGPTLDDIQAAVFTPTCSVGGCHSGPAGGPLPTGMDLTSADASFDNLVGIASVQQPAILRVAAGDPDNSYLIQKLEGTAASGAQMPFGGPPLDAATIADIRQWISDGAAR
ncbi:MAG: Ig-like domain-containing protein [Pseudomonadota bacterium]